MSSRSILLGIGVVAKRVSGCRGLVAQAATAGFTSKACRRVGRSSLVGARKLSTGHEEAEDKGPNRLAADQIRKIKASDVLMRRQKRVCQVPVSASLEEAIGVLSTNNVPSAMVYDVVKGGKEIIGMFTARDVLKQLHRSKDKVQGLNSSVRDLMTPMSKVIFCSPEETLDKIQWLMTEFRIRNLPVLKDGVIYGLLTLSDVTDYNFSVLELGGKRSFIKGVTGRLGLPLGTKVASHVVKEGKRKQIKFKVGCAALPHPFKRPNGVGADMRSHGPREFATDLSLSEDASFVLTVPWLHEHGDDATFIGLADGVGSWREHGVDPRAYAKRLMELCEEFICSVAPKTPIATPLARPLDVLSYAWERITKEGTVGSCTACVATLDHELNQMSFCNVGDNGIIIMSHIDSDVAGYMRDKTTPRPLRTNDLRIAYVSRQQLRSFNLPYQLGNTNTSTAGGSRAYFETPADADNSSIPVQRGDTIVIATDGLYDNVELEEITSITLAWEKKWFSDGKHSGGLLASNFPEESVQDLAQTLCRRARELSLDRTRDSPFAQLAKDNDILWGGGMPDDCTVVAIRCVKADR